jgi:1,2-phenylacetyl-CoA epoxidase catalytic subunit
MDTTGAIKEIERHLNIAEGVILRLANDNERLRAVLQEIANKGDVDADECMVIAKRALEK